MGVGYAFAHYAKCHDGGRYHGEYHNAADNPLRTLLLGRSYEGTTGKMHQTDPEEGGNGDEDSVDEEKVECPQEIEQVSRGKSITCGTERRHERSGDGNTRNDVALAPRAQCRDACCSTKSGDEYIIDGGGCTGQKLTLCLVDRRNEEINHGRKHTDECGYGKVAPGFPEKFDVVNANGQSHANDRSHEWGYQHGSDNHCCGIDIQAQRCNEDGKDEHPQVSTAETHALTDLLDNLRTVLHIGHDVEVTFHNIKKKLNSHSIWYYRIYIGKYSTFFT